MKFIALIILFLFVGCSYFHLEPYCVRAVGGLQGKRLYEITCQNPTDCLKENKRLCDGKAWHVIWRCEHSAMVQCNE